MSVNKILVNNNDSNYTHSIFDISEYTGRQYSTLSDALNDIPQAKQKGGMTIRYVPTNGNKYIQARCMAQNFTTDVTQWQGVFDIVEDNSNLSTGKGIKLNTVEEKEHPIADNDVEGYITDKNKSIIAKLMKNGAVEWLVENSKDIANNTRFESIEDFLSYVSSEAPDSGNGIIKYLTDKTGVVIATINYIGDTKFYGGGGFAGEFTSNKPLKFDAVKVLTDPKGKVVGWISKDGKVHLYEIIAEKVNTKKLNVEGESLFPSQIFPLLGFLANGTENFKYVNDKTYNLLKSYKGDYQKSGVKVSSYPVISIGDDDAYDLQLPESCIEGATPSTHPSGANQNRGGFASLLFPVLQALNKKHEATINGKIVCDVAAEGQRIGLTPLYGLTDTFDGNLNTCGQMVKQLIVHEGWGCLNHGMTARYVSNSYLVDGLNSEFANSLLTDATYSGPNGLGWNTTTCYDTVTKKNYKVKQDLSGWDECPVHYAKPYLALTKASNSPCVLNPTYSVEYQVNEWKKRATQGGMPFDNIVVEWGDAHGSWHNCEDLKYVNTVIFRQSGEAVNTIPFKVNPGRCRMDTTPSMNSITEHTDEYNVYNRYDYERLKSFVDEAIADNGWVNFMTHTYKSSFINNYVTYFSDLYGADSTYCGPLCYKDNNYPSEWVTPLKYEELMDMIEKFLNMS